MSYRLKHPAQQHRRTSPDQRSTGTRSRRSDLLNYTVSTAERGLLQPPRPKGVGERRRPWTSHQRGAITQITFLAAACEAASSTLDSLHFVVTNISKIFLLFVVKVNSRLCPYSPPSDEFKIWAIPK